ncbi:hypothetical protein SH449x_003468 [Pirellulaceae bacterium SH449]
MAAWYQDWKVVFLQNCGERLQIWKEPFVELRAPDLYNLRCDQVLEANSLSRENAASCQKRARRFSL